MKDAVVMDSDNIEGVHLVIDNHVDLIVSVSDKKADLQTV